jgi:bifunctional DNA-binding transcriptional regulator/antitoxin component of YhaV-PrlF toxin-antitoxin module
VAQSFLLKIIAGAPTVLPEKMIQFLGLREGDELEFSVNEVEIESIVSRRANLFSSEILERLKERADEMESGIREPGDAWELLQPSTNSKVSAAGVD